MSGSRSRVQAPSLAQPTEGPSQECPASHHQQQQAQQQQRARQGQQQGQGQGQDQGLAQCLLVTWLMVGWAWAWGTFRCRPWPPVLTPLLSLQG